MNMATTTDAINGQLRELTADEIDSIDGGSIHLKLGPFALDATPGGLALTAFGHQIVFWADGTVS
jgi:hypothetical protein